MNRLVELNRLYAQFNEAAISMDLQESKRIGLIINRIHTESIIDVAEVVQSIANEKRESHERNRLKDLE